jgi:hypothetical protein
MSKHSDDSWPDGSSGEDRLLGAGGKGSGVKDSGLAAGDSGPSASDNCLSLGVDIGGTHISAALVADGVLLSETLRRVAINPAADPAILLDNWAGLMNEVMGQAAGLAGHAVAHAGQAATLTGQAAELAGNDGRAAVTSIGLAAVTSIGLAMPGPFDYPNGISMIRGLDKYESLYGLNIREALRERLIQRDIPIRFENDAACFGLREARSGSAKAHRRLIAITLGTGLGACFVVDKQLVTTGVGVPPNGYLQKLYSWALNNHWETNYRAYQDGIITFHYALQPHEHFDASASTKFSTGLAQPLIVTPAVGDVAATPRLQLSSQRVVVLVLKPSTDGKAWMVTLFNPNEQAEATSLSWSGSVGAAHYSNTGEEVLAPVAGAITLAGQDVVTIRVEQ